MKSILVFYKEASLLDESFAGSRSSVPQIHRGCMAHVELQDDRFHHIHYHAVPSTHQEHLYCDEIFESCLGH
ncbi:MAG TPA: hypothetical protein VES96_04740 [Nitrospiraceae bacterium]|nr:hypothetical protein [Nitrospiraceae bacterium]